MRTSDSPYVADWFIVSLRWLVLLGVTVSLALGGRLLVLPNVLLIGLAGWNIVLTLLAGLNRRLARHREISLGIDLLAVGLYFYLAGGFSNPAFWVIILPLLTAALYFEVIGAFVSAALMILVEIGTTILQSQALLSMLILGASVFITFLIAGVFGFFSMRLIQTIRRTRLTLSEAQQKKQRVENDRMRAIYGLTSTLTATLNYQRVGGPCTYKQYKGEAEIVSVTQRPEVPGEYEIKFSFHPRVTIKEEFARVEGSQWLLVQEYSSYPKEDF